MKSVSRYPSKHVFFHLALNVSALFYAGVYVELAGSLLALGHGLGRWQTGKNSWNFWCADLDLEHAGRLALCSNHHSPVFLKVLLSLRRHLCVAGILTSGECLALWRPGLPDMVSVWWGGHTYHLYLYSDTTETQSCIHACALWNTGVVVCVTNVCLLLSMLCIFVFVWLLGSVRAHWLVEIWVASYKYLSIMYHCINAPVHGYNVWMFVWV